MRLGGIILCGGRSIRMGQPKALMPFGDATMLERVVQRVASVVSSIVVVTAAGQHLPALPPICRIMHDQQPDRGPLEGLRVGLTALAGHCDAAFVTACDAPLLVPEVVTHLASLLGEAHIIVPVEDGLPHPLSAIYRVHLGDLAQNLLQRGESRLTALLDSAQTRKIDVQLLRKIDPELQTFRNLNTPQEYQRAARKSL
jgi:molybdenum cofactor guanylyltransferase